MANNNPQFERDKMFYVCVQHYVDRGNPIDTSIEIIELAEKNEGSLKRIYDIILGEEKRVEPAPIIVDLSALKK